MSPIVMNIHIYSNDTPNFVLLLTVITVIIKL